MSEYVSIDSPLDLMKYDMGDRYIPGQHLELINDYLMQLLDKDVDIDKLCVVLPPRHGKSTLISIYFPAYIMMKYQHESIMQVSYGKELIEGFVQQSRDIVSEYGPFKLDDSWARKDSYKLERPNTSLCFCAGTMGAITGKGATVLIMDDLIKGTEEATSPNHMRKLRNWYEGVLLSRLHKGGLMLMVSTRWSPDDIVSQIMEEDGWTVLDLPVYAEEDDIMNRKEGEVLWPEYLDEEFIEDKRKRMGEYWFNVEYMGRPYAMGGNEIDVEQIQTYWRNEYPRNARYRVLYVDPAFTDGRMNPHADETCITVVDNVHGHFYLEKQIAGRWDTETTKQKVADTYRYYAPDRAYMEQVSASIIMINDLLSMGIPITGYKPGQQKKENRIRELIPYIDNGRVHFKTAQDWDILTEQIRAFPMSRYDDRLDSLYGAVHHATTGGNPYTVGDSCYEGSVAEGKQSDSREIRRKKALLSNPYGISKSG